MVKKIQVLESKMQDLEEELVRKEEVRKATALLQTEHTALMASKVKLEERMKVLAAQDKARKKEVESYVATKQAEADRVLREANEKTKKVQEVEARVEKAQSAVNQRKAELKDLAGELSEQATASKKETSRLDKLEQGFNKRVQDIRVEEEKIVQVTAKMEAGEARQAEKGQDLLSRERVLKEGQNALKAGQDDLESQKAKLKQQKQSMSVIQARVGETEKKVAAERLEIEQVEEQNDLNRQALVKEQEKVKQDREALTKEQEQLVIQKRGLEAASLELRISESKVKEKLNLLKLKQKGIYGVSK